MIWKTIPFAVSVAAFIGAVLYARGRVADELLEGALEAVNKSLNRLVVSLIFAIVMFMRMSIASEALPTEEAEALASIITVAGVDISPWLGASWILIGWTLAPTVVWIIGTLYRHRKYGEEMLADEFWSDSA